MLSAKKKNSHSMRVDSVIESLESRELFSAFGVNASAAIAAPVQSHAVHAKKPRVGTAESTAMPLSSVRTFSYDLADLSGSSQVAHMAQSNYDMLVVDPSATYKLNPNFDMQAMVAQLHANHPGRVVLAYLNIGEASDFRTYWQSSWVAPTSTHGGSPSFLLQTDPDGWSGSYPVAFWSQAWQNLFVGPDGIVPKLMKAGFDGVFLDWVGDYQLPTVAAAARQAGLDPASAMVNFVSRIRAAARKINPNADVVGLNSSELAQTDPKYLTVVDALAAEDTWFSGTPGAQWGDPAGGDIASDPSSTATHIADYNVFKDAGKPVFTIDYALTTDDVNYAYQQSSELGYVPLVTQVSLAQMTQTPPPWLS